MYYNLLYAHIHKCRAVKEKVPDGWCQLVAGFILRS